SSDAFSRRRLHYGRRRAAATVVPGECSAASFRIGCPVGLVAVGAAAVQSRVVSAAPEVLKTVRLRKTFESEGAPVRALRGIDLLVAAGEFIAVTGPSGCGKSTVLHLVPGPG